MGLLQDNKRYLLLNILTSPFNLTLLSSRRKISNDPNNTKWTRDTTTFGQKILRSQGWQPGQFLGAQDAPHAELHSAASASYIRVVLKDDMKGLGFNKAREDEVTGLDVFSDLLSRLNGKSEAAVLEDQDARLAVKTHRYVEMRWGPMRFVRGGLLVGDTLEEDGGAESEAGEDEKTKKTAGQKGKKDKKSKKRKVEEEQGEEEEEVDSEAARNKDKKRRRKEEDEDDAAETKRRKKEKKEKKETKKLAKSRSESDDSKDNELDEKAAKKKANKEKKEKKKEKREKKEEKKRRRAAKAAAATADAPNSSSSISSDDDDEDKDETDAGTSATSVTAGSSSGTATPLGHRTFVRSRYIAQKRQAVMDAKALAQIFMIKA
ncbi:PinX1-related protein [Beauveria brongniartii RCEF 3172]|uniref:PinX1-related protein n=1 Tax=Beauveria brongniartii RCEF 3172 TaxID=1081107 RepID=A0A166X1S9_9HYPO|nr:PinX1-related protein [Beauveria brongniartii RCEF 3172]